MPVYVPMGPQLPAIDVHWASLEIPQAVKAQSEEQWSSVLDQRYAGAELELVHATGVLFDEAAYR